MTVADVLRRVNRTGFHPSTTAEERSSAGAQLMALAVIEKQDRKWRRPPGARAWDALNELRCRNGASW